MGEALRAWEPQPRQAQALACPAFELFYGGAKGGGKSDFLLGDFLAGVEEYGEAWKGIIFRRTYKELEEIIARSREIYGKYPGATYTASGEREKTWIFPTGAALKFRHLESDLDVGGYQGHQYTWIGFDELSEFPSPGPYIFMLSCARSAAGAPCYVRATGNPGRPGHGWIKARFIDPAKPFAIYRDPETDLTRCYIPARLEDNTRLMENDPDYEKRLLLLPMHLRKAFRLGDWDVIVGQVFLEFRWERNTIDRQPLDATWGKFSALDWGYAKPFSLGKYAVNQDGRVIRYGEWYGCDPHDYNVGLRMGAREVAKKWWSQCIDDGITVIVADPACWSKDDDNPSIAETFESVGFTMVKANNDRHNGLQKLHDLMQVTGLDGKPMFLVTRNCTAWIRTVPNLTADPRDPEDIDTNLEDHPFDETKYALMSEYIQNPRRLIRSPVLRASAAPRKPYDPLSQPL
jgi:hypothetical protein